MRGLVAFWAVLLLAGAPAGCTLHEGPTLCDDDLDNDADGTTDCADTDCALSPACLPCGDGHLDDTEGCDDGNIKDGDGCSHDCLLEKCGDHVVDPGEECDDGNVVAGDGCNFRCKIDHCGDFVIQPGEECDDGNARPGDGCSALCHVEHSAHCGDFNFDPGEQCDDGNVNDNDGCSHLCQSEFCGDHIRQSRLGEQCDDQDGTPAGAACINCQIVHCGNGVVEPGFGEECDPGPGGSSSCFNCRNARCGDFFISPPEQCDDGNRVPGDGCSELCRVERCGDGVVQLRIGELCDPGSATADCVNCSPLRACAGDVCFRVSRDHPFARPAAAAMARGASPLAVTGGTNQTPFLYDIVNDTLQNGRFSGNNVAATLASADEDGDGTDEIAAGSGSTEGFLGFLDHQGNLQFVASLSERIFDIRLAQLMGDDRLELLAVARNKALRVVTNHRQTILTFQATFVPTRVVVASVGDGGTPGAVIAGGKHLQTVRTDGTILTGGAELALEQDVTDLAAADIDDDGDVDVVLLFTAPDVLMVMRAQDGVLASTAELLSDAPGAQTLAAADVDGDGRDDLVTAGLGAVVLHRASAAYAASPPLPGPENPTRVDVRDIDGDGKADLFYAGGGFFQPDALLLMQE